MDFSKDPGAKVGYQTQPMGKTAHEVRQGSRWAPSPVPPQAPPLCWAPMR